MHTTNLRKVGGSIMLAVPPVLLDLLELRPGAKVGIGVEGGRLIIEPRERPHYTLKELLAQCDANAPITEHDGDWLNSNPTGDELI